MAKRLAYIQNGDYLIPNVQVSGKRANQSLDKYARMRRAYLLENNTLLYDHLVLTEQIFPHLQEIQSSASVQIEVLMAQLLAQSPAPDKKQDSLGWAWHMNMLKSEAEELVCNELIFN